MKLIGNLKKQVDSATDVSEKRAIIEKAGMMLSDDELNTVTGGSDQWNNESNKCPFCGSELVRNRRGIFECPKADCTWNNP